MQTRLTLEVVPPTSTSADCTRERLRLMLKLKLTPLATMAFPWPTTPATPTGLESELLDSPPPYGCRGKRSAEPVNGLPLLRAYHHAPLPLPFLHHLVPTATGEVNESGAGYEVKQTHGLHASSFHSVTRGEVAEEEA